MLVMGGSGSSKERRRIMRVMVVGGTGTIGTAVADALEERHEVLRVGHTSGDRQVDLASRSSIRSLLESAGEVDAVVCAAGNAAFGPLSDLDAEDVDLSLHSKLRGQVELARLAFKSISDGGSITLTSGVLAAEPTPGSAAVSMVNAGVEGFVRAAALEAPRDIRINVVSPPWVAETLEAMGRDPSEGMPAERVARSYVAAVEGSMSGEVLDAREVEG